MGAAFDAKRAGRHGVRSDAHHFVKGRGRDRGNLRLTLLGHVDDVSHCRRRASWTAQCSTGFYQTSKSQRIEHMIISDVTTPSGRSVTISPLRSRFALGLLIEGVSVRLLR